MKILSTLFLILNLVSYSFAQRVVDSKRGSNYTYIFKASEQLAAKVYKKDFSKYSEADFKTLVDSIHVDSLSDEDKILPIGHY
jgi:hypothetical protein